MMRAGPILALLLAGTMPAMAKDCRIPEGALGPQVQALPGCKAPAKSKAPEARLQAGAGQGAGFVDLGNGTQVRVSGRVRAEGGFRR
ncbi:hypothetical protein [Microvirga sp. 2TAF3]|uniref:hypothetical protein n=1 Tax=Microvirga sp. 2TAF3 TaxID=3233014 RepID=UPI003F9E525A